MKAITLIQPWATMIAVGAKTYETRSWSTSYRGMIAIHAGKSQKYPPSGVLAVMREANVDPLTLPYGKIVCVGFLTDCIEMDMALIARQTVMESALGDWQMGRFAWKLENIKVLQIPFAVNGSQRLWNWQPPDYLKLN